MATINRLPVLLDHPLQTALIIRTLRLNCVTDAYADLWHDVYTAAFTPIVGWRTAPRQPPDLGAVTQEWTANTPLRIAEDRRQALVEIDALVALMLGVTADQLCTIYRTQFAVLYGYDHWDYVYDANGRLVPNSVLAVWRKKGDGSASRSAPRRTRPGTPTPTSFLSAARPGGGHAGRVRGVRAPAGSPWLSSCLPFRPARSMTACSTT